MTQAGQANGVLGDLLEMRKVRYVPALWIAIVQAGLDDRDQVMVWLEAAFDERYFYLVWLRVTPFFEAFQNDPQFVDLLKRIGL